VCSCPKVREGHSVLEASNHGCRRPKIQIWVHQNGDAVGLRGSAYSCHRAWRNNKRRAFTVRVRDLIGTRVCGGDTAAVGRVEICEELARIAVDCYPGTVIVHIAGEVVARRAGRGVANEALGVAGLSRWADGGWKGRNEDH